MNVSFNIQPSLPFVSKINILLNFAQSYLSAPAMGPHLCSSIAATSHKTVCVSPTYEGREQRPTHRH